MVASEFGAWLTRTLNVLPDLERWFSSCSEEQRAAVMEAWEQALSDVTLRDANAAVYGIISGDFQLGDAKGFYERQLFAAIVRKHARELVNRRYIESERRQHYERRTTPSTQGENWKAMYRYVSKAANDGVPKEIWFDKGMRILSGEKFDDVPATSRIEEAP